MQKFLIAAVVAAGTLVANAFYSAPLLDFAAACSGLYLAIFGAIMLGYGLANSLMMVGYEKTLRENSVLAGDNAANRAAKCLGAGFGILTFLVILLTLTVIGIKFASIALIFGGLAALFILSLGYNAKRFRDGNYRNDNIR